MLLYSLSNKFTVNPQPRVTVPPSGKCYPHNVPSGIRCLADRDRQSAPGSKLLGNLDCAHHIHGCSGHSTRPTCGTRTPAESTRCSTR